MKHNMREQAGCNIYICQLQSYEKKNIVSTQEATSYYNQNIFNTKLILG